MGKIVLLFAIIIGLAIQISSGYQFRLIQTSKFTSKMNVKLGTVYHTFLKAEETPRSVSFEREDIDVDTPKEKPTETEEEYKTRKEISDEMRKKLLREIRSTGGDPNYSAGPILGNPVLLISILITVLVILGGKGIFY